jgi:hypothetical protein
MRSFKGQHQQFNKLFETGCYLVACTTEALEQEACEYNSIYTGHNQNGLNHYSSVFQTFNSTAQLGNKPGPADRFIYDN